MQIRIENPLFTCGTILHFSIHKPFPQLFVNWWHIFCFSSYKQLSNEFCNMISLTSILATSLYWQWNTWFFQKNILHTCGAISILVHASPTNSIFTFKMPGHRSLIGQRDLGSHTQHTLKKVSTWRKQLINFGNKG